jgi:hypothetical protein
MPGAASGFSPFSAQAKKSWRELNRASGFHKTGSVGYFSVKVISFAFTFIAPVSIALSRSVNVPVCPSGARHVREQVPPQPYSRVLV